MKWAQRGTEFITDITSGTLKLWLRKKVQMSSDGNMELFFGDYSYADELTPVVREFVKGKWAAMLVASNKDNASLQKFYRDEQVIANGVLHEEVARSKREIGLKAYGAITHIKETWPVNRG